MRKLSDSFMHQLQNGFLADLRQRVADDIDLDLQIRSNSINIYYKGNSLLKLDEVSAGRYRPEIHPKFTGGVHFPDLVDEETTQAFLGRIPFIKENIQRYGKSSLEIEYEQMIIRANNYEPRNNSEYFIIDRQYTAGEAGRFDLTGIYWPRARRRKGQTVSLCLMELKFALNPDIQHVHEQLGRYYPAVRDKAPEMAEEAETVLRQKLELGLFKQSPDRLEALKTLTISRDIEQFQFIVVLVDYNPYSSHFRPESLASLPFAHQIKIFQSGFALWSSLLKDPSGL